MTLNITILTPHHFFQSADYRLSNAGKALEEPSTKILTFRTLDLEASVTYTGIGKIGTTSFSDILAEWMASLSDSTTFDILVNRIEVRANQWINRFRFTPCHSIIIAAFQGEKSICALVSNFQDLQGKQFAARKQFTTYKSPRTSNPFVLITGYTRSVSPESFNTKIRQTRSVLRRVATSYADDPQYIRRMIARENRKIALSMKNIISKSCIVYSMDDSGNGRMDTFGTAKSQPKIVSLGTNIDDVIEKLASDHFGKGNWTFAGFTSAHSRGNSKTLPDCKWNSEDFFKPDDNAFLLQLADASRANPRAINSKLEIVGEATPKATNRASPCFWHLTEGPMFLSVGQGVGGRASDINDAGTIIGNIDHSNGLCLACVWHDRSEVSELDIESYCFSRAHKIGDDGSIVGWVSLHKTQSGQMHQRPAIWQPNGEFLLLKETPGDWGNAVDINSTGEVLIRAHSGSAAHAFIWRQGKFIPLGVPDARTHVIYPKRLFDDGSVYALTISAGQRREGQIWRPGKGWQSLFEPQQGREFVSATPNGLICGYDTIDGYSVGWTKHNNKEIQHLSAVPRHYNKPIALVETGQVVGTASADHCSHPIIWNLST